MKFFKIIFTALILISLHSCTDKNSSAGENVASQQLKSESGMTSSEIKNVA